MYFRSRKSDRVKQGRPQIPTKNPITIEESQTKKGEIVLEDGNIQDVTSSKNTPMKSIRRHSSMLASLKQAQTPTNLQDK